MFSIAGLRGPYDLAFSDAQRPARSAAWKGPQISDGAALSPEHGAALLWIPGRSDDIAALTDAQRLAHAMPRKRPEILRGAAASPERCMRPRRFRKLQRHLLDH